MIARLADLIAQALLGLAAMLAFLLCFLVCADVIGRVAFNSPVKGHARDRVVGDRRHLLSSGRVRDPLRRHDLGRRGDPPRERAYSAHLEILGALLGVAFFGLICWGSIEPALYAWTSSEFEGEGALRVPAWPARFVVVLGTFLAALNYLLLAADRLRALQSGSAPAMPGPSSTGGV